MSFLNSTIKKDFIVEPCWYKGYCGKTNCNGKDENCFRYMSFCVHAMYAGVPRVSKYLVPLRPAIADEDAFIRLQEIKNDIVNWVSSNNNNLYICSETSGNGKTTWAVKLLYKLFDRCGERFVTPNLGLFINVPEFLINFRYEEMRKHEIFQHRLKMIKDCKLVIWDDISSGQVSRSEWNLLYSYINKRQQDGLANIFTGGVVSLEKMKASLGSILASRVWTASERVVFVGSDQRELKGAIDQ